MHKMHQVRVRALVVRGDGHHAERIGPFDGLRRVGMLAGGDFRFIGRRHQLGKQRRIGGACRQKIIRQEAIAFGAPLFNSGGVLPGPFEQCLFRLQLRPQIRELALQVFGGPPDGEKHQRRCNQVHCHQYAQYNPESVLRVAPLAPDPWRPDPDFKASGHSSHSRDIGKGAHSAMAAASYAALSDRTAGTPPDASGIRSPARAPWRPPPYPAALRFSN